MDFSCEWKCTVTRFYTVSICTVVPFAFVPEAAAEVVAEVDHGSAEEAAADGTDDEYDVDRDEEDDEEEEETDDAAPPCAGL